MNLKYFSLHFLLGHATCFTALSSSFHSLAPNNSLGRLKRTTPSLYMSTKTKSNDMDSVKSQIGKAISIGAPAYNAGDIDECARVYKETALSISELLPKGLKKGLDNCIQTEFSNSNEEAWAFRKQFDGIMDYEIPFTPNESEASKHKLEPFTDRMIPSMPVVVNDNVMGGISQGGWDGESKTFTGNTSLANNGGFSSIRWRMNTIQNWSYAKGIYLKVKHSNPEEHTFRLILKDTTCEQVRLSNFKNVFCNPEDNDDDTILLPFESFNQMEQMGRPFANSPPFNRGAVTELGLMAIKPTVVGSFELKILEWGVYV